MARTKKIQVLTSNIGRKYIICSECSLEELEVPSNVSKVMCSSCVQKIIAPPDDIKQKSDKPRGWHFKTYFEHNGEIYSKGKLVTDPSEINALKNSLHN